MFDVYSNHRTSKQIKSSQNITFAIDILSIANDVSFGVGNHWHMKWWFSSWCSPRDQGRRTTSVQTFDVFEGLNGHRNHDFRRVFFLTRLGAARCFKSVSSTPEIAVSNKKYIYILFQGSNFFFHVQNVSFSRVTKWNQLSQWFPDKWYASCCLTLRLGRCKRGMSGREPITPVLQDMGNMQIMGIMLVTLPETNIVLENGWSCHEAKPMFSINARRVEAYVFAKDSTLKIPGMSLWSLVFMGKTW